MPSGQRFELLMSGFTRKSTALLVAALLLLTLGSTAPAQSVRQRILDDIVTTETGETVTYQVRLTVITQYLSHFPETPGDRIYIRIRPIPIGSVAPDALFGREAVSLPKAEGVPAGEVEYEGDVDTGPLLTFRFDRPVTFQVAQGNDFQSLILSVSRETVPPTKPR